MAGRVVRQHVGYEAIYPRATGHSYEAEIRVGLYATEQEAQVGVGAGTLGPLPKKA